MESVKYSVLNKGLLLHENVTCFVPLNDEKHLIINKWMVQLPDSDQLTLEDSDGFRYKRVNLHFHDHYVFEKI